MKKVLFGLVALVGVTVSMPSDAQNRPSAPHAAQRSYSGGIVQWICPPGFAPITYPYNQVYTYTVVTGYTLQTQPIIGPLGRIRGYRQVWVPQTETYTETIPGGITYCVPAGGTLYLVPRRF